jgi:TetR/AcrR family transcriptional regulator, regulator of cefoperazone and chloramphenicol sensitivity
MDESISTRDRLLDAATSLFAERGVDNVSVAEIVRAAHQRNTSAVRYHIGNRDDLLLAVLERYVPVLSARRHELLIAARKTSSDDRLTAVGTIVRPVAELAQLGWRERAYLRIGSEISGVLDRMTPEIRKLMRQTEGYEAWDLLRERCPEVPDDLWRIRCELCVVFVGQAAADRARHLEVADGDSPIADERFIENLIEMVLGAMTAPHSLT